MPNPSIDYIFDNTRRRNRFAIFVAVVIAFVCLGVYLATAPADSPDGLSITQPTEGR